MIDETKCSWPIEPIQIKLTRIKGPNVSLANIKSAYNQMPLDKPSQRLTYVVIAGQQNCHKNKTITYLDDVSIQDLTTDTMLQTHGFPNSQTCMVWTEGNNFSFHDFLNVH